MIRLPGIPGSFPSEVTMKVRIKSAYWHEQKVYKKGDVLEIETAAFNSILMAEIAEAKVEKVPVEKPVKTTKTTKKKG